MELAIHILEALIVVCMAFVMVIAVLITKDLSEIISKYDRKVETLKNNEQALREMVLMLNQQKQLEEKQQERTIFDDLADAVRDAIRSPKVKVVDNDKPLDFPNDKT